MVLSGSLREFVLADVFQLLSQQKITGKLTLNSGGNEGNVFFRDGVIVGAEKSNEKFDIKLFNYLVEIKKIDENALRNIFNSNIQINFAFCEQLVSRHLLSAPEITSFAQKIVEDITCSLFLWSSGTYRFNSLKQIDSILPQTSSITTEAIVMEAMRRYDEWNRMIEYIGGEIIFVNTNNSIQVSTIERTFDTDLLDNYVLSKINGMITVNTIVRQSYLSEYAVYESLYRLTLEKKIVPLPSKYTQSIADANERNHEEQNAQIYFQMAGSVLTALGIAALIICVSVFSRITLLQETVLDKKTEQNRLSLAQSEQKLVIATLHYRAEHMETPQYLKLLSTESFLTTQDIDPLIRNMRLSKSDK